MAILDLSYLLAQIREITRSARRRIALVVVVLVAGTGCSFRSMAIRTFADVIAESSSVYSSDEDPELVRDALPFSLKTLEMLLESSPEGKGLLLSACSGFSQYSYAFLQTDAEITEWDDYARAEELRTRARKMYVRARDYCLRRVELDHPGITARLQLDPENAVTVFDATDVDTMYWLAGSWGLAIASGLDQPALVADYPAVREVIQRALKLDEDYNRGALHVAGITIESMPAEMGSSVERAREHFARAVELSRGVDASPYVTFASSISVETQDRAEFEELLNSALMIDPDEEPSLKLLNLILQKRARHLLGLVDELFGEPVAEGEFAR
jgi:predicted anti-sigma-YlaC factor YlaD